MDINLEYILGSFGIMAIETQIRNMAMSRFLVSHSASQDEKTRKVIEAMAQSLDCVVVLTANGLDIQIDIDQNGAMKEFMAEYSTLKDQYEQEINTFVQPFIEGFVEDQMSMADAQERLMEMVKPQIIEEFTNILGGVT